MLYKSEAEKYFTSRLKYLSDVYKLKYKSFKLSNARTKWGSCTIDNRILISWRLIMAPPEIIDYVIKHELAHTQEKNHSKSFWELVKTMDSNYKSHREWLKDYGYMLDVVL